MAPGGLPSPLVYHLLVPGQSPVSWPGPALALAKSQCKQRGPQTEGSCRRPCLRLRDLQAGRPAVFTAPGGPVGVLLGSSRNARQAGTRLPQALTRTWP